MKVYSDKNIILQRTKEDIKSHLDHFYVATTKDEISGVISYHDYGKYLKEVRSLAVKESVTYSGIGSLLVKKLISHLTKDKKIKIFVLTYSPKFFLKNNFEEVPKDSLPEKIWKDCNECINKDNCGETALVYKG